MRAASGNSTASSWSDRARRLRIRLSWPALGTLSLFVATAATVIWLADSAWREVGELGTAELDNVQFTLGQAEVEYLNLVVAIAEAQRPGRPEVLTDLRRAFDIFYSRVGTLEQAELFDILRDAPDFEPALAEIDAYLANAVPLIDAPDALLRGDLGILAAETRALGDTVRSLALSAIESFAEISDQRRQNVRDALMRMAALVTMMFFSLCALLLLLLRLYQLVRHRADELDAAGARMRTIIETSLDGIVLTDAAGRILEFSAAARSLFGYGEADVCGRDLVALLFPDARRDALPFFHEGRGPRTGEAQVQLIGRDRDGRRFPVEVSVAGGTGREGAVFVVLLRDISDRRVAEEALTRARDRALAGEKAKADFLAIMSHEMRTPLNGLMGTLQILADTAHSERQSRLMHTMQTSGKQLLRLVDDVLDLSKFDAGKVRTTPEPFDAGDLLDDIVATTASLAAANGTRLGWSWVGDAPAGPIVADAEQLRQVALNFVGNAIKFTIGGRIDIEAEIIPGTPEKFELRVIDTGIGIEEADLGRIFEDFETLDTSNTRKAGGTGLGLAIARRLTDALGGTLGAESEPDEGSLFWIRIPLGSATAPERVRPAPDGATRGAVRPDRELSVLIVDDNPINRFVLSEMLKALGHGVTEASDGRKAVDRADAQAFDAILMDISMPVMDGCEAVRRIRAGTGPNRQTRIIGVTAHALPGTVADLEALGVTQCLVKPIDRDALRAVLRGDGAESGMTPHPETSDAEIDMAQIRNLSASLPIDRLRAMAERFGSEAGQMLHAVAAGDCRGTELAIAAHRIAGSSATFGLLALRRGMIAMEATARDGGHPDAATLSRLTAALETGRAELTRSFAGATPPQPITPAVTPASTT